MGLQWIHAALLVSFIGAALCHPRFVRGQKDERLPVVLKITPSERSVGPLPNNLHLEVHGKHGLVTSLELTKNERINPNMRVTYDPKELDLETVPEVKNVAYYQDRRRHAAIAVRASAEDGPIDRTFEGTFALNGERYELHKAPLNKKERGIHFAELGTSDGNLHILRNLGSHIPPKVDMSLFPAQKISVKVTGKDGKETLFHVDRPSGSGDDGPVPTERDTLNRTTRGTPKMYHIELLFLIDYTVYDEFRKSAASDSEAVANIKYYYSHILNGMDLSYASIESDVYGIAVRLWLSEMFISTTPATSPWTEKAKTKTVEGATGYQRFAINGNAVLKNIALWLWEKKYTWKYPDHAMVWTKMNLFGDGTIGLAWVGGVCRPYYDVSVSEDSGFHSWTTSAHELGHNMGMSHDGSSDCSPNSQYIMSPVAGGLALKNLKNSYTFSPCSIRQMKDTISGKADNSNKERVCLRNTECKHGKEMVDLNKLPGKKYSMDEQCAMNAGPGSTSCTDFNGVAENERCLSMACKVGKSGGCASSGLWRPADGSKCADGKMCYKGKCVADSNPPTVNAGSCSKTTFAPPVPSGCVDSKFETSVPDAYNDNKQKAVKSCTEMANLFPNGCSMNGWAIKCCKTCHEIGAIDGNKYKDKKPGDGGDGGGGDGGTGGGDGGGGGGGSGGGACVDQPGTITDGSKTLTCKDLIDMDLCKLIPEICCASCKKAGKL